jgi:WD40 repeat protein
MCLAGTGDLRTGKVELSTEFDESGYPWTQDISPDGRLLIRSFRSRGRRRDITELLDLRNRTVITNSSLPDGIVAARFTSDGNVIVASEDNGLLHWWRLTANGLKPGRTGPIGHFSRAMALSPDGAIVAVGGLSRITLVDYETGAIRRRFFGHSHDITGLAFSPDGGTLASSSLDGTVKLWNLKIMQEVCTITFDVNHALGKEIGVQGVEFAPDCNSLWAFSRSGVLKNWRAAKAEEIASAQREDKP